MALFSNITKYTNMFTISDQERFSIISHDIIANTVTKELREIFKKEWDERYPNMPWNDDNKSLNDFNQVERSSIKRSTRTNTKYLKNTGNREEWDASALFQVLLFSRSLDLKNRKNKTFLCIDQLRNMRNSVTHHHTQSLSKVEFNDIFQRIITSLTDLNCLHAIHSIEAKVKRMNFMKSLKGLVLVLISIFAAVMIQRLFSDTDYQLHPDKFYFPSERTPPYFQGRDAEIEEISQCLMNGSYTIVNIIGMPAIGKTSTAIAVGQHLKETFNQPVVFVDLRGSNSTSDILSNFAMSVTGDYSSNFETLSPAFVKLLRTFSQNTTTLILDNIEDILLNTNTKQEFHKFLKTLVSNSVKGFNILCTSRKWFEVIGINVVNIHLKPLKQSTSASILRALHPKLSKISANRIAELTGGIPLLLELIGSHLKSNFVDPTDLISEIEEQNIFVVSNDVEDMTDDTNLFKLIRLLYERLDSSIGHMFVSLTVFDGSFTKDAAIHISHQGNISRDTIRNTSKAIGKLQKLCMLENLSGGNGDIRYAMHHILRTFVIELSRNDLTVLQNRQRSERQKEVYITMHLEKWEEFISPYRNLMKSFTDDPVPDKYPYSTKSDNIYILTFHRFESAVDSMIKLGNDERLLEAYFILGHLYASLDYHSQGN